jgi:membrane protease YdiL (CAAX protease family)
MASVTLSNQISSQRKIWNPWLCVGALFCSQAIALVPLVIFFNLFPQFVWWMATPFGQFFLAGTGGLVALGVVVLFVRPKSVSDFLNFFGLRSIPEDISYFGIVAGLVLGLMDIFFSRIEGVDFAQHDPLTRAFAYQAGPEKHLLIILSLLGPIFEEIIMRGFLYRAFRQNYGTLLSTLIIVAIAMLTHLGVVRASLVAFFFLSVLNVILCVLLERTNKLWNCIFCHVAYNAVFVAAWIMQ